tara:strand:- start:388 stop:747 length:360 start_codon:yes stop_codon:yes gene_type:complete
MPISSAWANVALATGLALIGGIREVMRWQRVRRLEREAITGKPSLTTRIEAIEREQATLRQDVEDYHNYDVTLWQSAPGEMRRDYLTRAEADNRREELLNHVHDLRDRIAAIEAVLLRR